MTIDRISGGWGGTGIEQTQASPARGRFRAVHDAARSYLGLSADELRGRLANGQSLAQVAEASGKSVHGLTQAIANAITKTDGSTNATSIAEQIISASLGARSADASLTLGSSKRSVASGLDGIRTAINDYLGLTDDEVRSQLRQGRTLAELAKTNSKSVQGLTQALADAITKLDSSVNAVSIAARVVSRSLGGPPPSGESAPSSSAVGAGLTQARRGFGGSSGGAEFENVRRAVNDFLGLTNDEVSSQLVQGQTLGEIAEGTGKIAADLERAIAKVIANGDSSADAAGIAHTIVTLNRDAVDQMRTASAVRTSQGGRAMEQLGVATSPVWPPRRVASGRALSTSYSSTSWSRPLAGPYEVSTILHEPPERATAPAWSTVFPPTAANRPIPLAVVPRVPGRKLALSLECSTRP